MAFERAQVEVIVAAAVEELLETIDTDFEGELASETTLVADAGFSSIDFVQMIVAIEEKLGTKVGFQELLMRNGKYVDDLAVGEVVDFIVRRLGEIAAGTGAGPTEPARAEVATVTVGHDSMPITEDKVNAFCRLIKRMNVAPETPARKNRPAVFILSPPRSGSTLLRVMLAGNPRLFAPPELHLLSYATMAERCDDLNNPHSEHLLEGAVRALMQLRNWPAEQARAFVADGEREGMTTAAFYAELQSALGDTILVDKTPTYAINGSILREAERQFENPLYVHLLRHPCGMIRSYEESKLARMMPLMRASNFSSEELAEMTWLVSNQNILKFSREVPAARWFSLSYESLVSDPEQEMRRLCGFIGIDYHADMVNPYSDNRARMTDGVQVASKMSGDLKFHLHRQIDPAAAVRWKQFCSEKMLGEVTIRLLDQLESERVRIRI